MENREQADTAAESQATLDDKAKYIFKLEKFEGPLDLLLFLIKKSEVNIYDIPISEITNQYLEYIEYATRVDLENITDFYNMAATLLYIKSRMLLPIDSALDEDIEDPRTELVEKLIEYQKYKKLSELIGEKEKEVEFFFDRKNSQRILPFSSDDLWEEAQVWDLLKIFSSIISNLTYDKVIDLYEEVTVNEKITLIRELCETKIEFYFTDILRTNKSVNDVVCTILAILELVKMKQIRVFQNKLFGDILLRSREEESAQGSQGEV